MTSKEASQRAFFVFLATTMPTATIDRDKLPRANVRNPRDPFPTDQYVKIPNVAIFSEHETKTPDGEPQRFDPGALGRLIERGNRRIRETGDYAAVCIGHTHDPEDGIPEQPEVIGAMGPYRLGLLGHPGQAQKYAILADLWIRRDKIDKYNAHPRRSVELWYEDDKPAWIDPLSLLTEAPRLDLGLTPLIDAKGGDGASLKYLYAASASGLRVVKYAAASPACGSVFVPAESDGKPEHYEAGSTPQTTKEALMLAPEDIRQIVDAIEHLDVIEAMKDFLPMIPRVQELLEAEDAEHAAVNEPGEMPGEPTIGKPEAAEPPAELPAAVEPPAKEPPAAFPPEDKEVVKHSADAGTTGKTKEEKPSGVKLEDLSEEEIERYLCDLKKKKYAADGSAGGKSEGGKPAESTVEPPAAKPAEGSVDETTKARYSALESKIAELEADRIKRINAERESKLHQLRYHRAFDLTKEIERTRYAKMNDEQFASHCEVIADNYTPTLVNAAMPVPDELLDSRQPAPSVRQNPERYTKDAKDKAVQYVVDQAAAGHAVSYETVLENIVAGKSPE